jgi:DNA-binding LacI/PurR family transcriptional regulator
VLLSRYAARLSCSWVSVDHIRASELLVTHLFEQGYRRVVFVADQGGRMAWQHYRREGFKDALRRQGLSPVPKDEVVVEHSEDALDRLEGIIRAGAATSGEALPSASVALFAVSDSLGVGLLNGLRERGLEAPRDYGIAGYDNLAAELPGGTDRLTSIGFPREQIGALACRVVRDVCDIPNLERQHIFITPELHARATSLGPGAVASGRTVNTPIRKSGVQSAKELASL